MMFRISIRRYRDGVQYIQTYSVDLPSNITVLDALMSIREDLDGTLAFRYACRMGICGICTVKVNGRPRLACSTKLGDLGTQELFIEPIHDKGVIRDLVVDLSMMSKGATT